VFEAERVLRSAYRAFNARDVGVVHDADTGDLISNSHVRHRYRLENGLVIRMDVLDE
jgi:hypothetical protein